MENFTNFWLAATGKKVTPHPLQSTVSVALSGDPDVLKEFATSVLLHNPSTNLKYYAGVSAASNQRNAENPASKPQAALRRIAELGQNDVNYWIQQNRPLATVPHKDSEDEQSSLNVCESCGITFVSSAGVGT